MKKIIISGFNNQMADIKALFERNANWNIVCNISTKQNFTKPPNRYSEAGLVKKLEELGIGRPSTYSSMVSVVQDRNYVNKPVYEAINNKQQALKSLDRIDGVILGGSNAWWGISAESLSLY